MEEREENKESRLSEYVVSRPERKAKKEIQRKKFSTKTMITIFIPLMIIYVLYMFYVLNIIWFSLFILGMWMMKVRVTEGFLKELT